MVVVEGERESERVREREREREVFTARTRTFQRFEAVIIVRHYRMMQ